MFVCVAGTAAQVAFWYISWPGRTMGDLAALVEAGRFDEANEILAEGSWVAEPDGYLFLNGPNRRFFPAEWQSLFRDRRIESQPRSFSDVLHARARFQMAERSGRHSFQYEFDARANKVSVGGFLPQYILATD
jgi:hypothetical protein